MKINLKELHIQAALGASNTYYVQFFYFNKEDGCRKNILKKYYVKIKTPDIWTAIYLAFCYVCKVNANYEKRLKSHHLRGDLFIDIGHDSSLWNSLNTKYIFDSHMHLIGARSKTKYDKVCSICTTFGINHGIPKFMKDKQNE